MKATNVLDVYTATCLMSMALLCYLRGPDYHHSAVLLVFGGGLFYGACIGNKDKFK